MKVGDKYVSIYSPDRGFTVVAVTARSVAVEVLRTLRDGRVEARQREVSRNAYETFARAYRKAKK